MTSAPVRASRCRGGGSRRHSRSRRPRDRRAPGRRRACRRCAVTASTRPPPATRAPDAWRAVPAWNTVTPSTRSAASIPSIAPPRRGVAGIALRGDDHGHRRVGRSSSGASNCGAGRDRHQQFGEVAFDARHDRLAFGIAEADIIFDQLGAVGGQHQPGIEHAAKRRSGLGHGARGRLDDLAHRPRFELGGEHRGGRIGAHAAGVGAGIALADALVVLRRCRARRRGCRRPARTGSLPRPPGIPRSPSARRPPRAIAASASSRVMRDGHALARGEAVGLDHHRDRKAVERGERLGLGLDPDIGGGRDPGARRTDPW